MPLPHDSVSRSALIPLRRVHAFGPAGLGASQKVLWRARMRRLVKLRRRGPETRARPLDDDEFLAALRATKMDPGREHLDALMLDD